jgi:hypothetical protein
MRSAVFDVLTLTGAGPTRTYTLPLQTTRTRHSAPAHRAFAELRARALSGDFGSSSTPQPAVAATASAATSPAAVLVADRRTSTVCRLVRNGVAGLASRPSP